MISHSKVHTLIQILRFLGLVFIMSIFADWFYLWNFWSLFYIPEADQVSECSAHRQKSKMKLSQRSPRHLTACFLCTFPHRCDRCGITTKCRWWPQSRTLLVCQRLKAILFHLRLWDLSIGPYEIVPRLREVCQERCESHVFPFTSPTSSTSHRLRNDQRGEDSSKICRCRLGVSFSVEMEATLILQRDGVAQWVIQL